MYRSSSWGKRGSCDWHRSSTKARDRWRPISAHSSSNPCFFRFRFRVAGRFHCRQHPLSIVDTDSASCCSPETSSSRVGLLHSFVRSPSISQRAFSDSELSLKELFRQGRGRNVKHFSGELKPVLLGWVNYFSLAEVKIHFEELDGWIRRRLRCLLFLLIVSSERKCYCHRRIGRICSLSFPTLCPVHPAEYSKVADTRSKDSEARLTSAYPS